MSDYEIISEQDHGTCFLSVEQICKMFEKFLFSLYVAKLFANVQQLLEVNKRLLERLEAATGSGEVALVFVAMVCFISIFIFSNFILCLNYLCL